MLQDRLFLAENSARVTIAQVFGGLLLFASILIALRNVKIAQENARTAQKTLQVTEDGKLTERFSKAVELLGSDKLDTRLGGVYALERIARDSRNDHWTVIEILTAFVREKSLRDWRDRKKKADEAKAEVGQDSSSSVQVTALRHKVEPDIQAALLRGAVS